MKKPKIILAINYVEFKDPKKKEWQDTALQVLVENSPSNVTLVSFNLEDMVIEAPSAFRTFKMLKRDSAKLLGNNRKMPYVKEILGRCSEIRCDIFGYINSDILVDKQFFNWFKKDIDTYVFSRIDIDEITKEDYLAGKININESSYKNGIHDGADGFFFRRKWWFANVNKFHDDLVLGEPYWDHYYRKIICDNSDNIVKEHACHHIYHETKWTFDSAAATSNANIWELVK